MSLSFNRAILSITGSILLLGCQSPQADQQRVDPTTPQNEVIAYYQGNLESSEYDSIVNQLTLYQNETFDLHQVDRIAEHRLHDRDHTGIYSYLSDSTQLGLYSKDGLLMLRFLLSDKGIIPLTTGGEMIAGSNNVWRKSALNTQ